MKKLTVYRPGHILRLIRAGKIADPQPRGEGRIFCERARHRISGDTESPAFWENGTYVFCPRCNRWALARVKFAAFEIDMRGERTRYPLFQSRKAHS